MLRSMLLLLLLAVTPQPSLPHSEAAKAATDDAPNYTSDGQLKMPEHYREWIFLSSGVDMSYSPSAATASHSMFDNVFVNPSAYRSFLQTRHLARQGNTGAGDSRGRRSQFHQQARALAVARDHGHGGPR